MTKIAIVGGGRAATVHAEAARAVHGVELVGVGGREPGTATDLATATGAADLPLSELVDRADGIVVAVPPRAVDGVLRALPADLPVLVESPIGIRTSFDRPGMAAINLLHADAVTRGLRAIRQLGGAHHLALRGRAARPTWGLHGTAAFGGGVLLDPGAGLLPLLLAAAGVPVRTVRARLTMDDGLDVAASVALGLDDGRTAQADLAWTDAPHHTELEAAGDDGVVALRLGPAPSLEIDGSPVALPDQPTIVALGFVEQMRRFAAVAAGHSPAWPPLSVADGVMAISEAAAESAARDGALIACPTHAERDPAAILAP